MSKEENNITPEMASLHESAKRICNLMDDPQTGLFTWQGFLRDAAIDMQKSLCSLGCTPGKCGIDLPEHLK